MKIGLAYDLKEEVKRDQGQHSIAAPDDALEEYDSLETVEGLAGALKRAGHEIVKVGGGHSFLANVINRPPEFVFNISEGLGAFRSREAQVPSVLEMLGIPYSGADPQCLAVCLDKDLTKRLVSQIGIPTPQWKTVRSRAECDAVDWGKFPFPAIVKPSYEGSSKGIRLRSLVADEKAMRQLVTSVLESYCQPVMVEEFVEGEEITVGIVGNRPARIVGIMRVVPKKATPQFVYSLEVKRDWENQVEYECPAKLGRGIARKIEEFALKTFDVLGCRDFGRADFRVSKSGIPYFLEINPLAGLNPRSSDLPIMAGKMGWSYDSLIAAILGAAVERYEGCIKR